MDGFYIAPALMDKLVVHVTKNFFTTLPKVKGKLFKCEFAFAKMGIDPIKMSTREFASGNVREPAKLIRQGTMLEMVDLVELLDILECNPYERCWYLTNVRLPGLYTEENAHAPIIVTGNDFSTLY
ncbi:hypothetical protein RJ641_032847 [Dillenia turbinata]|uniref:Uncharacterized protein n=1 Tax=Dillenia turbinata TaxID=194707 RepID=A0AAN8VYJ9_9MAGN